MLNKLKYSIIIFSLLLAIGGMGFLCKNNPLVCVKKSNHFFYSSQKEGFLLEQYNMPTGIYKRKPFTKKHKDNLKKAIQKRYTNGEHVGYQKGHKVNLGRARLDMRGKNNPMQRVDVKTKCGMARKQKIDDWVTENSLKHLCHCGCGNFIVIERYHYNYGIPRYIYGHSIRVTKNGFKKGCTSWNSGKRLSKEGRIKLSLAHGGTGISRELSEYGIKFNNKLKEQIRKRDNYECQKCGMNQKEHLIVYGQILTIHHIDYDKKNCKEDNLITLCCGDNTRVNYNRKYWQAYFEKKIKIVLGLAFLAEGKNNE